MRKLILYNLLLFFSFSLSAQLDMEPDSLSVSFSKDTAVYEAKFTVTNNYTSSATFWWKLERDENFPEEWKFQVCDANLCYFDGVDACPAGNPNVMEAGSSNPNFSVKIKPNGVAGSSLLYYTFYADSDLTTELVRMPIYVVAGMVSADDLNVEKELTIFPNPTIDKFHLTNSKGIEKVEVFNIAGKLMKSFKASPGREYHVNELRNGLYLVRFINTKGKIEKVVRLSKK